MFATVIGFLAKIGIGAIADRIAAAYEARERAPSDKDRVAADERIKTLETRRDVLVAESGSRINATIRAAIAMPVATILWKIFVYDKALGQWTGGRTDPLSPELWQVVMVVIGFYFLAETASTMTRIVKRK